MKWARLRTAPWLGEGDAIPSDTIPSSSISQSLSWRTLGGLVQAAKMIWDKRRFILSRLSERLSCLTVFCMFSVYYSIIERLTSTKETHAFYLKQVLFAVERRYYLQNPELCCYQKHPSW